MGADKFAFEHVLPNANLAITFAWESPNVLYFGDSHWAAESDAASNVLPFRHDWFEVLFI